MKLIRLGLLTLVTMLCFAGNSILCRLALKHTTLDAASFTSLRLISGAVVLAWLVFARQRLRPRVSTASSHAPLLGGNWISALALFVYAAALSFSYADLSTGIGALLLFGAVQATMIVTGLCFGERLSSRQMVGMLVALIGVVAILLPALDAPPLGSAALMLASGAAWGVYSLRGRGVGDPTRDTAGNFLRAAALSVLLGSLFLARLQFDAVGVLYALLSGAITSGVGYALWYAVLPHMTRTRAATVQLSVPVLAALAGAAFAQEPITLQFVLTSLAVLGGIALVVLDKKPGP